MILHYLIFILVVLSVLHASDHQSSIDSCGAVSSLLMANIEQDLLPWKDVGIGIQEMRAVSRSCPESKDDKFFSSNAYLRVTIDNGTLYLNSLFPRDKGMEPWVDMRGALLELYEVTMRHPNLPNVDLTLSFGDEPTRFAISELHPILSIFKGRRHRSAILYPNSGQFRCTRTIADGVDALMKRRVELASHPLWSDRLPIAVGRFGNDYCPHWVREENPEAAEHKGKVFFNHTTCPRRSLTSLSLGHNDTLNIMVATGPSTHIPLLNQSRWKYIVSVDGWGCTNRLDKLFLLGSVVVKQESLRYGWYYSALKPWENYVPIFSKSPEDILEAVKRLKEDDKKAHEIARAGRLLAETLLTREARICYWKLLIEKYAALQTYHPSCRYHRYCVPALHELQYLGSFELTGAPLCSIHKQLNEILIRNGTDRIDHGGVEKWGKSYGLPGYAHGQEAAWLHEHEIELRPEDIRQRGSKLF